MDIFIQQLINGLTLGSVYAVVALGYTMVYGIIQLINFAHGELVMIGAMVAFTLIGVMVPTGMHPLMIVLFATSCAVPVCMLIGYTMERLAYRPLRRAPRLAPLITAIGVSIILQHLALLVWSRNNLAFPQIIKTESYAIAGATITNVQIAIMLISVAMMTGLALLVYRTRLGTAMRATAQNAEVAGLMGIDINRMIAATFVLGAALAAVAGVMVGSYYGIAHYQMGALLGLKAFAAAVLGGIGNLPGAMLGGVLLGLVEALGGGYIGDLTNNVFGSNYQDVFAFIVLITVLVLRPSGLLGERVGQPRMKDLKKHPAALWGAVALVAIALIALPFALSQIGTAWVRITNLAILFTLLALGLNIVVGFAGLLDLGYVAFYAVGAYAYALLASPHFGLHLPFWLALPIGAAIAALFGLLLGAPTLKLRGDYLAIVTLGFGEIVRIFLNNLSRPVNITNGPQGISLIDPFSIGGVSFAKNEAFLGVMISGPMKYYWFLLLVLVAVIAINLRLQNSRIGRAWEAVREDETAARAMGIDTTRIKLLAFAMGASFGGVAGGMFAAIQGFISPESFVLTESIMVVAMVVLGGMGNIRGVILGALLLSFVPEILRYTIAPLQQAVLGRTLVEPEVLRMLVFGFALVLIMLFRPAGLLPSAVRKRELTERKA